MRGSAAGVSPGKRSKGRQHCIENCQLNPKSCKVHKPEKGRQPDPRPITPHNPPGLKRPPQASRGNANAPHDTPRLKRNWTTKRKGRRIHTTTSSALHTRAQTKRTLNPY